MPPSQKGENPVIKGLDPKTDPVNAQVLQAGDLLPVHIRGIGLNGDLGTRSEIKMVVKVFKYFRQDTCLQERGGPAADIEAVKGLEKSPVKENLFFEGPEPGRDQGGSGHRVKGAIGALAPAKGNMDIETGGTI
jgi:hypothetical protein